MRGAYLVLGITNFMGFYNLRGQEFHVRPSLPYSQDLKNAGHMVGTQDLWDECVPPMATFTRGERERSA